MSVALKEANETGCWLMLLHDSDYLREHIYSTMKEECDELIRLLARIAKTTKEKLKQE